MLQCRSQDCQVSLERTLGIHILCAANGYMFDLRLVAACTGVLLLDRRRDLKSCIDDHG